MAYNPWTSEMLANDYHLGSRREAELIARENGNDPAIKCGNCNAMKGYRKGTVGAVVCYACGSVQVHRYARVGESINLKVEGERVQAVVTSTLSEYEGKGNRNGWCTVEGSEDIHNNEFVTIWTSR